MSDVIDVEEQVYRDKVGALSKSLFDLTIQTAQAKVNLELVKKDRSAPPESIYDMAQNYRHKEKQVLESLYKLIDLHVEGFSNLAS